MTGNSKLIEGEIKSRSAIAWSLVIHSLLLVVIIIQVNVGAQRKKEFFESDITTKNIVKTSVVVLTHPVKIKEEKVVEVEVVKEQIVNEKSVVEKSKVAIKNQPKEIKKESTEKLFIAEKNNNTESKSPPSEVTQQIATSKDTISKDPTSKDTLSKNILLKSKNFIQHKINAAPTYKAENEGAGMSMMNNTLSQHRYNAIEEKTLRQKLDIKITCDSVASKTTAFISTFTGGRFKCEKGPDLSPFIKQKEKPRFKYKLD